MQRPQSVKIAITWEVLMISLGLPGLLLVADKNSFTVSSSNIFFIFYG